MRLLSSNLQYRNTTTYYLKGGKMRRCRRRYYSPDEDHWADSDELEAQWSQVGTAADEEIWSC